MSLLFVSVSIFMDWQKLKYVFTFVFVVLIHANDFSCYHLCLSLCTKVCGFIEPTTSLTGEENLHLSLFAVSSLSIIISTTISTYEWWSCSPCDLLTESKHLEHSHFYEGSCCLIFLYYIFFRFGVMSVCWCLNWCCLSVCWYLYWFWCVCVLMFYWYCFVCLFMFLFVLIWPLLMSVLMLFCLSGDVCIDVVLSVCWCFY